MTEQIDQVMSVLGLEIGSINTHACLFDVVEDNYRLIASAVTASTHVEPSFDTGDAIYEVISRLQEVTGRTFFDHEARLIMPAQGDGEGVDRFVITTSCVPELNLVAFGLLNEVSMESVKKLAYATYANVAEMIGINDRRPQNIQLDAVLASKPDIILLSGGTDNGANRSLTRISELIGSVLQVLPRANRPQVLYCGNSALADQLRQSLDRFTKVKVAQNIRPSLDREVLEPAMDELNSMVMERVYEKVGGLQRLSPLCSIPPRLSNQAFHRVIRFLGQQYDPAKGVLGFDIGASYTTGSYSNRQFSSLNTFNYGMGEGISTLLDRSQIRDITRWLREPMAESEAQDYLWQRSIYPQSIPVTQAELSLELGVTRQILRLAMRDLAQREALPSNRFEPILISGSTLNRTATSVQSLLTILDGIQPLGICPLILDKHGIMPLLGAIAEFNPLLAVQVLESTAFTNLATVVNIASKVRSGGTVLTARLEYPDGNYLEAEVKQGSIVSLPLAAGTSGQLYIRSMRRGEIEEVGFTGGPLKVNGGVCGLVLDARGRPLKLSEDAGERKERFKEWEFLLGTG